VTDGSGLYPKILAELWPEAHHRLCVFHVLNDLYKQVLDAWRRMRRELSRRGQRGRKPKRGRRPKARAQRRGLTNKEKSAFIFKHRFLIVKRRDRLSPRERADLETMLNDLPESRTLWDFVDHLQGLFEEGQSEVLAWDRHAMRTTSQVVLKTGDCDGTASGGEARQDDRVPEEPGVPSGVDKQPCGTDQPHDAAPGESAIQVEEATEDRSIRGVLARPLLEAGSSDAREPARRARTRDHGSTNPEDGFTGSGCVMIRDAVGIGEECQQNTEAEAPSMVAASNHLLTASGKLMNKQGVAG